MAALEGCCCPSTYALAVPQAVCACSSGRLVTGVKRKKGCKKKDRKFRSLDDVREKKLFLGRKGRGRKSH